MKSNASNPGVRLETHLLKVIKGLAEYRGLSLGDLLEGVALHAFENKSPSRFLASSWSRRTAIAFASTEARSRYTAPPERASRAVCANSSSCERVDYRGCPAASG